MFLIVGLGNPGVQYANTRHNVGFLCVNNIAHRLGFPDFSQKNDSLISERRIDGERFIIQKPQTFMNLSGRAVQNIVSFYKIDTENIIVVHDDLDLNPFEVRIKFAGGNGGHNGLRDIDSAIGKNYWRARIGIGRPLDRVDVSTYVLSNFYRDEIQKLYNILEIFSENIKELLLAQDKNIIIQSIMMKVANRK